MKIAISGSSGLIGSSLVTMFKGEGDKVITLGRDILYGPAEKLADYLYGVQVVIHLAGAPINMRWTKKNKDEIYNSRIVTTRNLVDAMKMMPSKPEVFICASAANIYPESGTHTEDSKEVADSFLGVVSRDWEKEAAKASEFCRTLHFRFTMVISAKGGALKTMLIPFKLGVGGKVGSGRQIVSWIHLHDLGQAVLFAIKTKELEGAVNIASPNPVDNEELSKTLGKVISRPSFNRVPPFMLKLLYGKASRLVIRGVKVLPARLLDAGFKFKFPFLEQALEQELGK